MNRVQTAGQSVVLNKPKTKTKKAPKNAFGFYLDYAVKELRSQGENISNKSDAVPYASSQWKNMTPEERAPYEKKAKEWKQQQKQKPKSGRLDCTGQLIDNRVNMEDFIETQRKLARKLFKSEWPAGKAVCDVHFYLISFQSLFELPDEEGYQPCEVACIDYTLNQGIVRVWHQFIDPGPIKLGMRAEIRSFSEATHRIPEQGFELASGLYHIIWNELLHFIKPNKSSQNFPPLFCRISEMRKTQFCLEWLSAHAGYSNRLCNLFELEDMSAELLAHAGILRPSLSLVEESCNSHIYDYQTGTTCKYHEEVESVHCAVLTLKKCCFWMSDALTNVYDFEITDKHLPVKQPPSYVITKPEMIVVDGRPRSQRRNSPQNQSQYSDPQEQSLYASRDIRYRGDYDFVPRGVTCTDIDPSLNSPVSANPQHSNDPNMPSASGDGASSSRENPFLTGNTPSFSSGRRPTSIPNYAKQQQQQRRSRLAANFQVRPRVDQSVAGASSSVVQTSDDIDTLSQDFNAASLSPPNAASESEDARTKADRAIKSLGRGRGRGWYKR